MSLLEIVSTKALFLSLIPTLLFDRIPDISIDEDEEEDEEKIIERRRKQREELLKVVEFLFAASS